MFLAFKSAGATDWRSNLAIALDHAGKQHKLQFHHIFPKAALKTHFTDREADDIANLAFIAGGTNRRISDKPPSDYIPALVEKGGSGPLISQGIPLDPQFLGVEAYKGFLTERRKNVAWMLNNFLGTDDVRVRDSSDPSKSSTIALPASKLVSSGEGVATRIQIHTASKSEDRPGRRPY